MQELILVVDDTPANLEVISEALADAGFDVAIATNGERGIQQAQVSQPSLILLDVMMPGIDGFETCHQLKSIEATKDIPVIFMTALSDTTDKVKGFSLGAADYITKPFQEAELIARVKTHLKLYHFTKNLEQQVADRTAELKATLEKLQSSQLQLIQSEKMAALGQLVAGIAHEVNNPIGFLNGSIRNAQEYTRDLLCHLRLYQKHYPHSNDEISEHAIETDLEFLVEDFPRLIDSMQGATDRIKTISDSLRNFSRSDAIEKIPADIHDGLDSTLMILKYRLKANDQRPEIKVCRCYGELPLVNCFPGQLNQVFMNILANAIDALDEAHQKKQQQTSQIYITTKTLNSDWIEIAIKDNGPGIPPEIQAKIFEPFFTTKPVGKGTGMGMSISNQIITEKHNGKLLCNSSPGQGTEFLIQIPCS